MGWKSGNLGDSHNAAIRLQFDSTIERTLVFEKRSEIQVELLDQLLKRYQNIKQENSPVGNGVCVAIARQYH
jgi:hypothetical protein